MVSGTRYQGRCPHCGVAVKEVNLARHLRSVHPSNREALRRARELEVEAKRDRPRAPRGRYGGGVTLGTRGKVLLVAAAVVAAGVAVAYYYSQQPNPNLTRAILDVCYGGEQLAVHRHATLNVTINGKLIVPQALLGIPANQGGRDRENCWRPLHTHDDTGTIHIEADVRRDWTLGEFFQVWAHDYVPSHALISATELRYGVDDKTIPGPSNNATLNVTVDGKRVQQYDTLVPAPMAEGIGAAAPIHRITVAYSGP